MDRLDLEFLQYLDSLRTISKQEYYSEYKSINEKFELQEKRYAGKGQERVEKFCKNLYDYIEHEKVPVYLYIHVNTLCIYLTESMFYLERLFAYINSSSELHINEKHYLFWQIVNIEFLKPKLFNRKSRKLRFELYYSIYKELRECLELQMEWIPVDERNQNFIMVITDQFLGINHGPTQTALDRCLCLCRYMKKKVVLLNSAMFMPRAGFVPVYEAKIANYKNFSDVECIEYGGERIPFFQCTEFMPDMDTMCSILEFVKINKPYCIFDIGAENLMSDLCSNIVPVIAINTVPSGLADTISQFQAIGRILTEEDEKELLERGKTKEHIIVSRFTSAIKGQTHHYSRKELELPENAFLLVCVGYRLEREMSEEFLAMLNNVVDEKIWVVFMGRVENYDEICQKFSRIEKYSKNLGVQSDAMAVIECCNLLVNPKRQGGGTSAVEAFSKGVPVVTLAFGDVGIAAGSQFSVDNFDEMKCEIIKYAHDRGFYEMQSVKAKERAAQLTDSRSAFVKILREAEEREGFE